MENFKKGDVIMHSKAGVCKVIAIEKNVDTSNPRARYYKLESVYTKGTTILSPVGSDKVLLRPLYTKEVLTDLVKKIPHTQGEWEEDQKLRKAESEKAIASGDIEQLLELVSTLYRKRTERKEAGKQLNIADQQSLKYATGLINEEFAYVFDVKLDDVEEFIDRLVYPENYEEEKPKPKRKTKKAA